MPTPSPLSGLTIIDFTTMIAGPYCTRLLADCGAEVIKIESKSGDYIRGVSPLRAGESMYFAHLNCGKKSVALDLTEPENKAAVLDLIREADVVVENFRPGVMKRLGLSYDDVTAVNPNIIYCSISGYGQTGPKAQAPAYAPIIHAASGYDLAMAESQDQIDGPINCTIPTADVLVGVYAYGAIQTALIGRMQNGKGEYIDVAMMDSMINLMIYDSQVAQEPLEEPRVVYGPIRAADGHITVSPISERNFHAMADAMGQAGWKFDARFSDTRSRRANWKELMRLAEEWTCQRSAEDATDILTEAGVPCAIYQDLSTSLHDPQVQHRGLMVETGRADAEFLIPNPPFKFSQAPIGVSPDIPELGAHNSSVLVKGANS